METSWGTPCLIEPRGAHLALSTYDNLMYLALSTYDNLVYLALSTYENLVGLIDLREPRGTHLALSTYENLVGNTFAVLNYENSCVGRMISPDDRNLEEITLIKEDTCQ